ncbi:MAG: GspE/PulE family protein [Candidatus Paceibacteria bacterium]
MTDFDSVDDLVDNQQNNDGDNNSEESDVDVASESTKKEFEEKMQEIEHKEKERKAKRRAKSLGFPHIDLTDFPVSQDALKLMNQQQVKETKAVSFYYEGENLRIGAIDPTTKEVKQLKKELKEETQAKVKLYVISQRSLQSMVEKYEDLPTVEEVRKEIEIKPEKVEEVKSSLSDFSSLQKKIDEAESTTDVVTYILGAGLKLDASDVHIEAEDEEVQVRLRIDGILHDAATLDKNSYEKVVSRIKLVASLKLNITDEPQDGRFTIDLEDEGEVDVRVSTVPTVYGESVVMRLLRQDRESLSLEELGVQPRSLEMLKEQIKRPNGMIITTGPTGSGKTTTLYASMQMLSDPEVKIVTLENPVEYKMEGINQTEVTEDFSFQEGLESMLRQDPDIAMVGEIRNLETAETSIQAALTGHLMLSTLHTNNAAGAVPRFLSMGVKPFLLAPALNCIIGQRLVRRLCDNCKQKIDLDSEQEQKVKSEIKSMPDEVKEEVKDKQWQFYGADGCEECNNIGFSGRTGIYEIFVIDSEFEDMILSGDVAEHEIEKKALNKGMMKMVQDGILKALDGVTSVEEVYRVIE